MHKEKVITQFTNDHETVLGIARTMIDKRDEVLKNSTTVNYNFLKELSIQRNERLITRLLKSILEFEIPTSEGATTNTTLLSSFIEEVLLVDDEDSIAEFSKLNKSKLSIELEHKIPSTIKDDLIYGQIDMVVHYELTSRDEDTNKKEYLPLIAIEVKIDAGDQYGQCSRYIRYMDGLKAKRKEHFAFDKLIYLSLNGKNPTDYAFYDKSPDNEIDESLRVINKGFTSDVTDWLVEVIERYKPYSTTRSGNEEVAQEVKVSKKKEDKKVKEKGDGFRIALLSLIEIIADWDKGETLMNKMYKQIEKKYLAEAVEIAKALHSHYEERQEDFVKVVSEDVKNNAERVAAPFQISSKEEKLGNSLRKKPHRIWKFNKDISEETLFLYLGTYNNRDIMYIGIMSSDLRGDKNRGGNTEKGGDLFNKINGIINLDSSREIIGIPNAKDFIWWCNILPEGEEKTLSFDTTNLDLFNPDSTTFKKYLEETTCIINSIFDAFDKEKEDKSPISE